MTGSAMTGSAMTGPAMTGPALRSVETDDPQLLKNIVQFARLLRRLGLGTTTAEIRTLLAAFDAVPLGERRTVKDAARTVLVHRREHRELFDQAFDLFWSADALEPCLSFELGRVQERRQRQEVIAVLSQSPAAAGDEAGDEDDEELETIERRTGWSAREVLRHKDFAEMTPEEESAVRRFLRRHPLTLAPRRTRRFVAARQGTVLDLRSALRKSLRTGGEPLDLAWRKRKSRRRPLVVLCDISGSMEVYSRIFLQLVYTMQAATDRLEAFVFGTRLTRITRQLRSRDVERALRDATSAVVDWGGGTRIGDSLKTFNYRWGRRVLGGGAVAVVISDGWDRGDSELLGREMDRLRRRSDRVLWLNPLLGSPGYEPLTRGIRTILPRVDHFLPIHNLDSLEQLGRLLATVSAAG